MARRARFGWIIALFLALIGAIVGFNARATSRERDSVLVVNVAARQRALAERYIKDVILRVDGFPADPSEDAAALSENANALLRGGKVEAVQGADATIVISPIQGDPRSVAKLRQERALINKLLAQGDAVLAAGRASPGFDAEVLRLRIVGAQVSSVSNDAVGEMTNHAQASLRRLVWVGLALGLVGAAAAVAMGLLLRRAGAEQAAQFRSLVQNASDVVTVLGGEGLVRYQSAPAEQILGSRGEELLGSPFLDLVHPDDRSRLREALDELRGQPGSVGRIEYRMRGPAGSWRHVESAMTNLLADPTVQGIVLNTRDTTERHEAEARLLVLQAERSRLLEQTVHATELERKRVAAELHDGPVQHLTALDLRLEALRDRVQASDTDSSMKLLDQLQDRMQGQVGELRKMMAGLRPPMLDERGLPAALQEHLSALEREASVSCSLQSDVADRIDPAHEVILYRVAQEAMANVVRHARATHAWVTLRECDGRVMLEVRDDGVGFDSSEVSDLSRDGHFGLLGMRERVELAGGSWHLSAVPGAGTLVRADLPLEVKAS